MADDGFLGTVEQYPPHLRVGFLNNRDLALALQDLHRKWAAHHARHAVRQTHHNAFGHRLPFSAGLARSLRASLPLLQVLRFERRLRLRRNRGIPGALP